MSAPAIAPSVAPRALIRLDVGEPDFATPAHIVDAGVRALREGRTRYGAPEGIVPLRAALADRMRALGHAGATAERVVVAQGAKPLLGHVLRALLAPGDACLVPDPGYPGYRAAVELAGGVAVPYPATDAAGAFALDVEAIGRCLTSRTRVLVLNSPHNPTGGVATDAELDALARLATDHDLHVVSDEVYGAITYEGAAPRGIGTRAGMAGRTVTVDSFSKTWAMTGWRLGWALLPEPLVAPVRALLLGTTTCTPEFVQRAGLAALEGSPDVVRGMVAVYRSRRDAMVEALAAIPGVTVHAPAGAFYLFPRVPGADAARLRETYGVACTDGATYGARGAGHLRLSCAASMGELLEAVGRVAECVRGR